MTSQDTGTWQPSGDRDHHRRPGELTAWELVRWMWRQLTSMRTALILLLLLALGAIPGSVIPQSGVDALKTQNWQDAHQTLTPIYEKLGLFSRLPLAVVRGDLPAADGVAGRLHRAAALRLLARLPPGATRCPSQPHPPPGPRVVHHRRGAGRRARASSAPASRRNRVATGDGWVAAERGQLREAGNLLFHLSVLIVLVGFGVGSLFGYKGGVILVVGNGFSNSLTQYDDFDPGSLFNADKMEPFCFTVHDFKVQWIDSGPRQGMARGFQAPLTYRTSCQGERSSWSPEQSYDLRVNHPLTIGGTQVFLIGHGYAPEIIVRDAQGHRLTNGPTVFLPESANFESFGVVKASGRKPGQDIGLEGLFYPTFATDQRRPGQRDGRRQEPDDLDARLHRRPRPEQRRAAVDLRAWTRPA